MTVSKNKRGGRRTPSNIEQPPTHPSRNGVIAISVYRIPAYIVAGAAMLTALSYLVTAGIATTSMIVNSDKPPIAGIARVEQINADLSRRIAMAEEFQMAATQSFKSIADQLAAQSQMARQALAERKTERLKNLQAALDIAKTKANATGDPSDRRIAEALQIQLDEQLREIQAMQAPPQ